VSDLDEFINEVTSRARQIANGSGTPSELGVQIWSLTLTHDEALQEVSRPLSLLWGGLTDPVDWPGQEPSTIEAAETEIKRAAEEWLDVAHDREARDRYFDRWLYEEFGYERQPWSNP
jgi:hypothetical protein